MQERIVSVILDILGLLQKKEELVWKIKGMRKCEKKSVSSSWSWDPLVKGHRGHRIQVTAELGERLQFTVLCLVYLECSCYFLHAPYLRASSYT